MGLAAAARAKVVSCWADATLADASPASAAEKLSNSLRANASRPQIKGGCAGATGDVPAIGLSTTLMTLDTRRVTPVNGFWDVPVAAGCDVRVVDTCAVTIGDRSVGEAAAGVRAVANTATEPGDGVEIAVGTVTAVGSVTAVGTVTAVAFGDIFWVLDFGWPTAAVCLGAFVES